MPKLSEKAWKIQLNSLNKLIDLLPKEYTMVEVGSYAGHSSWIFAKRAKFITCVDPWIDQDWNKIYKITLAPSFWTAPMLEVEIDFDNRMKEFKNFKKLKTISIEASKFFENNSLDFVYIDAIHTYDSVKEDITLWLPKIKKGGCIGGHDYSKAWSGVVKAVHETLRKPDYVFEDCSWLVKL